MTEKIENLHYAENISHKAITSRSTFAQFIAGTAVFVVLFTVGMMLVLPTLAIGSLRGTDSNEVIILTNDEASWFGSLMFLLQPFSSILGAFLQPHIGRKYGLMLTLVPQIISWICLSVGKSVPVLYLSVILFGISAGSMEAPAYSYLGEISEPRLRSLLTCMTFIAVFVGMLFEFFLASIFHWRQTAAVSTALPVIGIFFISFVPDSPLWLLQKGKEKAAIKSLCWLRGWVEEDSVKVEFEDMRSYITNSKILLSGTDRINNACCLRTNRFRNGMKKMTRSNLWQPLLLMTVCHFCYHSISLTGMRSYFVEILRTLPIIMDPSWFLFINSLLSVFGGMICFLTVKFLGKRKLILSSSLISSFICILLGGYIFWKSQINIPWIPSILIWVLNFFLTIGIGPVPWMLMSEIFSASDRSLGAGLGAALHYVIAFPFSKTFYNLQEIIHLSGCFILYGVFGFIGFLYLYLYLPETEGKSLAEVEEYFSRKSKNPVKVVT